MPTLRELDAHFIRYEERLERGKFVKPGIDPLKGNWIDDDFEERDHLAQYLVRVETLAEAQGIWFDCPLCYAAKGNTGVGVHGVSVSFAERGVPDHQGSHNSEGKPVRWQVAGGTGLDDLQLSPSILLIGGCAWHGFIGHSGVSAGHAQ